MLDGAKKRNPSGDLFKFLAGSAVGTSGIEREEQNICFVKSCDD